MLTDSETSVHSDVTWEWEKLEVPDSPSNKLRRCKLYVYMYNLSLHQFKVDKDENISSLFFYKKRERI